MAERKTVKILRNLDKKQLTKFNSFLLSPYFNTNKDIIIVLNVIKKYLNSKQSIQNFDDFLLQNCLKEGLDINLTSAEKHLSNLYYLVLDFFANEELRSSKIDYNIYLLKYLYQTNDLENFNKVLIKTEKALEKKKKSLNTLDLRSRIMLQKASFASVNKDYGKAKITFEENTKALDNYYVCQRIFLEILNLNISFLTNSKYNSDYFLSILNLLPASKIQEVPLLNCWYHVHLLYNCPDIEKLSVLKKLQGLLNQHINEFSEDSIFNLYNGLHSFAPFAYNNRRDIYQFKIELYKHQIKNKAIYTNGKIMSSTIKNIVNVGIKLKEFSWLENFLESHKSIIVPKDKAEDAYNYNFALLKLHQCDFDAVQNVIVNLKFKNIFYKIGVKRLELMLYFEKQEWLLLDSLINAFRVGLTPKRTESLPKLHKSYNLNFIKYFHKLFVLTNTSKSMLDKNAVLYNEVNALKEISEKDWLLEKIAALK